jgi:diacylglycerol O-acyltransferase
VPHRLAWIRADVADIAAVGRPAGATLNDLVMTAVAGGLRSLLLSRGDCLPIDVVRKVLVPVSRRPAGVGATLGNRVAALDAQLPVGIGDPGRRLAAVSATMRRLKARPESDATGRVLDAYDVLPPLAGRLVAPAVDHQRMVNLVVTTCRAPRVSLHAEPRRPRCGGLG